MKLIDIDIIDEKEELPESESSGVQFTHYFDNNANAWRKTGTKPEEYAKVVCLTPELFVAYSTLTSVTGTIFKGSH